MSHDRDFSAERFSRRTLGEMGSDPIIQRALLAPDEIITSNVELRRRGARADKWVFWTCVVACVVLLTVEW